MATGLSNSLTRQIGEHLVTAELGRRGIVATPFAGNIPNIDILAFAEKVTAPIQVKAITPKSPSWQFDVRRFLEVDITPKGQIIQGKNEDLDRNLFCVFIALGDELGKDDFLHFQNGVAARSFSEKLSRETVTKEYQVYPLCHLEKRAE
ncbi:MAG: hypothetical protein COA73_15425 [Candidatus Hydrogenedentota bacterium]|nr:MAG: hypothetical protein COA73_15425 [Candidatus Hydrogenedentota bacterium]